MVSLELLESLGIDPHDVPCDAEVRVTNSQVEVEVFVRDGQGRYCLEAGRYSGAPRLARTSVSVARP